MALCSYQSYRSIRKTIAITAGAIVLLVANSPVSANRVTLVATVNNQIVLLPANWSIFKLSDKELQNPIATLPRHTGTVHLPAGQYRATVKQNHITKETEFRVESKTDKTVTIALD